MNKINPQYFNIFLVGFCFLTIYTSKAGMNIALALLLIGHLIALRNFKAFKEQVNQQPIFIMMYAVFTLALIAKSISFSDINELATTFRKGAFLLLTPFISLLLLKKNHLDLAKNALILGACIAIINSYYQLYLMDDWSHFRVQSFWDVGRWSELLGYLFVGIIPFILVKKNRPHLFISVFFLIATLGSLLIANSRGAILVTAIVTFFYLLFHHRKLLLLCTTALVVLIVAFSQTKPVSEFVDRIASVASSSNASNNARKLMWGNGILLAQHHIETDPVTFLFGTSTKELPIKVVEIINTISSVEEMQDSIGTNISIHDFHNAYINNINKNGLVYFLAYITLLAMLAKFFWSYRYISPSYAWAGINLLSAYLMLGVVYSNEMEFQTACLFFILSVMIAGCLKTNNEIKHNAS
ncbi:O-antigen ligase family protein [Vibrio tapetis]|uniref:O-antigen ligase-related domain-containing protein n=1 Tax=Vibrio tapetis subsp. tapetis TaxID=1671868 RepID=A0A2N8ZGI2_9VIBR|nr:O-antigen ligase family protein [Vibrio tapetis]SON51031.1 conserved membrane protein of unknown function [Vibrio tapetis subsp. tapetis]